MFRRRFARRRFAGRTRRRTRWLAIVPNSNNLATNNAGSADEIIVRDLEGNVQFNDFVGGVLLKVILTMESMPGIGAELAALDTGFATDHHGIFLTADESVSVAAGSIWDPNIPSGNFMIRWSSAFHVYNWSDGAGTGGIVRPTSHWSNGPHNPGPQVTVETNVRRRISENMRLWITHWHFEDGVVVTNTQLGWTGRVLIALP